MAGVFNWRRRWNNQLLFNRETSERRAFLWRQSLPFTTSLASRAVHNREMAECYAGMLGDCDGQIEDEHFVPQVLQRMVGPVVIEGMAWQRGGRTGNLRPGAYAPSRIVCQKHH